MQFNHNKTGTMLNERKALHLRNEKRGGHNSRLVQKIIRSNNNSENFLNSPGKIEPQKIINEFFDFLVCLLASRKR